jgi:hypothetical protein
MQKDSPKANRHYLAEHPQESTHSHTGSDCAARYADAAVPMQSGNPEKTPGMQQKRERE